MNELRPWYELTPWFDGSEKPARPGVYERDLAYGYAKWTGHQWLRTRPTVAEAEAQFEASLFQGAARWRGLARPPGGTS